MPNWLPLAMTFRPPGREPPPSARMVSASRYIVCSKANLSDHSLRLRCLALPHIDDAEFSEEETRRVAEYPGSDDPAVESLDITIQAAGCSVRPTIGISNGI